MINLRWRLNRRHCPSQWHVYPCFVYVCIPILISLRVYVSPANIAAVLTFWVSLPNFPTLPDPLWYRFPHGFLRRKKSNFQLLTMIFSISYPEYTCSQFRCWAWLRRNGITGYRILDIRLVVRMLLLKLQHWIRAGELVAIINKIVEFVENLILFTLKSIEKYLFSCAKSCRVNIYGEYKN